MMTDHTPEPWLPNNMPTGVEARQTDYWIVLGADDWLRARACVNACAGIPTEQLGDVRALVEALEICATPIRLGDQNGLDFEGLAREVNRRQTVAFQALAPFRKD